MEKENNILYDSFGRKHSYLRISLTELCNLRCTYCMPEEGIQLSPKSHIMTYDEVFEIASVFVKHGVTKIRLTGGEPLIRRDVHLILKKLAELPVELAITSNVVIIDRFINLFKECRIKNINVSLDSLDSDKFKIITRRNNFQKVYDNILLLVNEGFNVKLNVVLSLFCISDKLSFRYLIVIKVPVGEDIISGSSYFLLQQTTKKSAENKIRILEVFFIIKINSLTWQNMFFHTCNHICLEIAVC